MFGAIARFILRNRILLLIIITVATVFLGWQASKVQLSYDFPRILPVTDSTYIEYEKFKLLNQNDISNVEKDYLKMIEQSTKK